jgi:membrane fusion protein (multidrug efflux system)
MKIKNILIIVCVLGALLAVKFFLFPSHSGTDNSPKQSKGAVNIVSAFVIKAEKLENTIYASGTILANEEAELKPEIAGKIIQLLLQEGSSVTKGQLLVKINDADFQAQLKKFQLEKDLSETQLKRQQELLKINAISQEDFEVIQNKVNTIKADMEYLQSQIAKTEIRAPFNGLVGLKNVSEGAYVTVGTVIATIQQINPVKIDFSIAERYSDVVKKGDKVVFTIEGNRKNYIGEVFAIEPRIDVTTRTLRVRAICPNSDGTIYPGAFARVQLSLNAINDAIMIPTEAIIPDLKGKKVYRIINGKAEFVKVETGLRTEAKIQITDGLVFGDTIVTTGIMQLKPGAAVKITEIK